MEYYDEKLFESESDGHSEVGEFAEDTMERIDEDVSSMSSYADSNVDLEVPLADPLVSKFPLTSTGATCNTFRLWSHGKTYFVKQMKDEFLPKKFYHNIYRKEFEVGRRLKSRYIVKFYNLVDTPQQCYIVMEYLHGVTLKDKLKYERGYFRNRKNLTKFLDQLLHGLQHLHLHQVIHLDLKPANIMLTRKDNDVKIIDLGFCYTDKFERTTGKTRAFAAPEQLDGSHNIDVRTDIYAVGKILQYIFDKTFSGSIPSRFRYWEKIMDRCLEKDKEKRFQSIDVIIDLNKAYRPSKWPWIVAVLAGVAAVGTLMAFLLL